MTEQLQFYMDVHIPRAITNGLRLRGIDILTAQEDGTTETPDEILLERAHELGRIFFTFDEDFLVIGSECLRTNKPFSGIVYAHTLLISVRQCLDDLELVAKAGNADDFRNHIEFLPLR
jgi:predicted nuclease of predicted toxin-antitoxin system